MNDWPWLPNSICCCERIIFHINKSINRNTTFTKDLPMICLSHLCNRLRFLRGHTEYHSTFYQHCAHRRVQLLCCRNTLVLHLQHLHHNTVICNHREVHLQQTINIDLYRGEQEGLVSDGLSKMSLCLELIYSHTLCDEIAFISLFYFP